MAIGNVSRRRKASAVRGVSSAEVSVVDFRSAHRAQSHGSDCKKMPTPIMRFSVAVVMQRTPLENRWASERWDPIAVDPIAAAPVPSESAQDRAPACIRDDATCTQWRFDGHVLELHRSEAEGYHLNLVAPDPKVF